LNAIVTVIHVVVSVVLILVILLQAGKGGGLGGAFGGSSQAVFGGRGAQTFLGKVTSIAAGVFMLTSLTLSYVSTRAGSVVKEGQVTAPMAPAQSPFQPPPAAPAPVQAAPGPAAPGQPGPAQPGPSPEKPIQAPPKW
jgi:preprotein translocase subunit SecG